MTTRIDRRFAALKAEGRAALVTFTMAGDPDYDTALAIAKALPKAGADVIELGMPFTDPMADGPAIQAANLRSLASGTTTHRTEAQTLRRVATALETARSTTASTPSKTEVVKVDDKAQSEELARLRDELARANAELERIKRRLAQPKP